MIDELAATHDAFLRGVASAQAQTAAEDLAGLASRTGALLRSVAILHECTARTRDAILAYGELASAPIVARASGFPIAMDR